MTALRAAALAMAVGATLTAPSGTATAAPAPTAASAPTTSASAAGASDSGTDAASDTDTSRTASAPRAAANAAGNTRIRLHRWAGAGLEAGRHRGTVVRNGRLRMASPIGTERIADAFGSHRTRTYERARWISPWRKTRFAATNLVPSWAAKVRKKTLVRVEVRVADGQDKGSWDEVALWSFDPNGVRPHSGTSQPDDLAHLATDTVRANSGRTFNRWKVRVTLLRPEGSRRTPRVSSVSGVAADRSTNARSTSKTSMKKRKRIALPSYSQMVHTGHHPAWGGGGEAWCSPTSMAMVVQHFGKGPNARALAFETGVDARVDHAARHAYDHRYRGTGNWPFTTAYAGNYGLDAYVTRLRHLRDAEKLIKQGVPLVVSVKFGRGELTGAPISSTNGHLIVISGFTRNGHVIAHDPAAATNAGVRRNYKRSEFERAWLGGSGGITYVVRPEAVPQQNARF